MSVDLLTGRGLVHPGSHWTGYLRRGALQERSGYKRNNIYFSDSDTKNKNIKSCLTVHLCYASVYACYSLPLRAEAVHAAVGGLAAGLPCHSVPHLHSQACLSAPLNGAAQFLSSCFYTEAQRKNCQLLGEVHSKYTTGSDIKAFCTSTFFMTKTVLQKCKNHVTSKKKKWR